MPSMKRDCPSKLGQADKVEQWLTPCHNSRIDSVNKLSSVETKEKESDKSKGELGILRNYSIGWYFMLLHYRDLLCRSNHSNV